MQFKQDKLLRAIAVNAGYDNIWNYIEYDQKALKHDISIDSGGIISGPNLIDWFKDVGAFRNIANGRLYLYGIEISEP